MKNTFLLNLFVFLLLAGQTNAQGTCASPTVLTLDAACVTDDTDLYGNTLPFSLCGEFHGDDDDDAVFTFTPTTTGFYDLDVTAIDDNYAGVFVYEAACPVDANTTCSFNATNGASSADLSVSGMDLTGGTTYYIIVTTWGSPLDVGFCIGVSTGTPPLEGLICSNPIVLPGTAPINISGDTDGFGDDYDNGDACGSSYMGGDDIVYSFTPDATGCFSFALTNTDNWVGIFLLDGCPDDAGATCIALATDSGGNPSIDMSQELTAGTEYFIVISTFPAPQSTAFDLAISDATCPPDPPSDACADPNPLCGGAPVTYPANTMGTAETGNDYGCLNTQPRPSWFYLEVATDGDIDLSLNNTVDLDFALWGPFADLSAAQASCGGLVAPVDCSYTGGTVVETPSIVGATLGEVYVLLVTAYSTTETTFSVTQTNEGDGGAGTTNCDIVPVELLSLNGSSEEKGNLIKWQTASELNTQYHVIERSVDGNNWNEIGREKAAGESIELLTYSFYDLSPLASAYYRIRTIDFDNSEAISNSIYLVREGEKFDIINVAPVPTRDLVRINYNSSQNSEVTLRLNDMFGKLIHTYTVEADKGTNQLTIDLQSLNTGVYFFTLDNGVESIVKRIMKN